MADRSRSDSLLLRNAALFFAFGSIVHTIDHFRRGPSSVTLALYVSGWFALALAAAVIFLIVRGHRLAPELAVASGFGLAAAYAASHWLPTWSVLSDSFLSDGTAMVSRAASFLEIGAALALGIAGMVVLRRSVGSSDRRPVPA